VKSNGRMKLKTTAVSIYICNTQQNPIDRIFNYTVDKDTDKKNFY